jgi:hypothetical protein
MMHGQQNINHLTPNAESLLKIKVPIKKSRLAALRGGI